jgi:hypothetical protein
MVARLRRLVLRAFLALTIVLALLAPATGKRVLAAPSLDLTPYRGPCTTTVTALGTGFAPGQSLTFSAQLEGSPDDRAVVFAQATVGPDGGLAVTAEVSRLVAGCSDPNAVAGQQYRLIARDSATGSLLAYALFILTAPEITPTLTLDPIGGPCATQNPLVTVRGVNFTPGLPITVGISTGSGEPALFPGTIVRADGTFNTPIRLIGCGPGTAVGTTFAVIAYTADPNGGALLQLAAATYNTDNNANRLCFTITNQCISGRFLARWQANGGLAINGYPLSAEFRQQLEDGRTYLVQYFERVRMEYHPEKAPPQDVLLGQFGRSILAGVSGAPTSAASPREGAVHFAETQHNLMPDFFAYWQANGGLVQFGYPLTEEFTQKLPDGKEYSVQYFERARFERHPENPVPYTILLGQFGREILDKISR